jgi:hypothetical protein
MSLGAKILAQANPAAATLTTLFTGPAAIFGRIEQLFICNRGAAGITVRVSLAPGGAVDALIQYILYDTAIPANAYLNFPDLDVPYEPGDVMRVYTNLATATFTIWGTKPR